MPEQTSQEQEEKQQSSDTSTAMKCHVMRWQRDWQTSTRSTPRRCVGQRDEMWHLFESSVLEDSHHLFLAIVIGEEMKLTI